MIDPVPPPVYDARYAVPTPDAAGYSHADEIQRGAPAWLASLILHTTLLVILVLVHLPPGSPSGDAITITLKDAPSDAVELTPIVIPPDPVVPEDTAGDTVAIALASSIASPPRIDVSAPTELADKMVEAVETPAMEFFEPRPEASMMELATGGMYRRDPATRFQVGQPFGATAESEDAVEAALAWLAAHQARDGSWNFDLSGPPCDGRCGPSPTVEGNQSARPKTAATGLALLAFLGAGYSHHEGKYAETVRQGLYFLRDAAAPTEFGYDLQGGSMYGHGIATLAISEAMAMTRYLGKTDSDLFSLTNGAATFTQVAQHPLGGWRYVPGSPGDMTVTAWQVLSLISAQHGGVVLRSNALRKADSFVMRLSKPNDYAFGYQSTTPELTTTAVGLCLMLYLGHSPKDTVFLKALGALAQRGPRKTDLYHDYYAAMALHHSRSVFWESWHVPLREHLIQTQETKGHLAGSWHFRDRHGDVGGRLYSTAMAAMILEVYYRYLPLYQPRDEFKLN